jgi:hypothetical protein
MQILGEDPPLNPLIGPLRITPTDTNDEVELNNSKTIPPEESVDQENTSPMSPQEGSSVTTTTQRRSTRASSGMGMPTILIDLITIYDDEEGSEASHITPVPITQEEELGETSAPASMIWSQIPKKETWKLGTLLTLYFSINWEHNLRMTSLRMTWI